MFMFNYFKRIAEYFFPSSFYSDRQDFGVRFYSGTNDEMQSHIKRNGVKGIVTYIGDNLNGRIDGYINFDSTSTIIYKCSEGKITVRSEVIVDLIRNSRISPWFATKVEVLNCVEESTEDWEDGPAVAGVKAERIECLPQKQVGMITYACRGEMTLNYDIKFTQKDCGNGSFLPVKGDWVVVEYDHTQYNFRVVGLKPLRYVDFEGRISGLSARTGYVDREIFFFKSIMNNSLNIRKGSYVYGTAIESVQGRRCNFRAITIFPKTDDNAYNSGLKMRIKVVDSNLDGIVNHDSIGISLNTTMLDFGEQDINCSNIKEIMIENKNDSAMRLSGASFLSETNDQFVIDGEFYECELTKGNPVTIMVRCKPQFHGLDSQKLVLEGTSNGNSNKNWKILIDVSVYVFDPLSHQIADEKSTNEITKSKIIAWPSSDRVSGIYLPAAKPVKVSSVMTKMYPHRLKQYPVPLDLETNVINKEEIRELYPILKDPLTPGNYSNKMNLLVHLEEINTKEEMKQFILEDIRLMSRRETFCIEVPGLSEGRPSLVLGDRVQVKVHGPGATICSGSIEEILCESIFVKFHPNFHATYTNELCTVTFQHSRLPFRRMHLGVDMACGNLGDDILFPCSVVKKSSQCVRLSRNGVNELSATNFVKEEQSNLLQLKFYNQDLNDLQRVAVIRIVHGYCRPLPYVLFGPPGTGKTVTLVESVLQVYKNVASSRILLCAPSNSAADLLCLRLHYSGVVETGEMVRMNAYRRTILSEMSDKEPIPPKILPYCKCIDDLPEIAMHRIIITTCVTSGTMYQLGLKAGHISHVFVDEAGQASEPEIMIPCGFINPNTGQIVLAGDPMQLGPVIRSPHAKLLHDSYLHRLLISCPLYQKQSEICPGSTTFFNPLVVTQLLKSYRAHSSLLKLSSDMFYNGSLIPCVEKSMFLNWQWLPNPNFPMIFHAIRGKELRNPRNPSTYNPSEAVTVVRWIGRLLQDSFEGCPGGQLEHSRISVITPYRAQVDCIRKMIKQCLETVNLAKLKVGSVEEFQGQENDVIIISTVRSSIDNAIGSGAHESYSIVNAVTSRLGFLSNKRRFNVSITRACSLLIVIGDPGLLRYDECWNSLINYAKNNDAYCGSF